MKLTIKLFATLRNNRFKVQELDFLDGLTVAQVAESLEIPKSEVALTLVNGILVETSHILKDADTLAIFPPVGGG
jgi:sulfur carrier protein